MPYILTQEEFEALDAVIVSSKLQDDGFYLAQTDDGVTDYFVDRNENLSLKDGLAIVSDSVDFDDLIECGYITESQLHVVLDLFDRFNIVY